MNKKISILISMLTLNLMIFSVPSQAKENATVTKYTISVDSKYNIPYSGTTKNLFPNGFTPGFGSGLTVKSYKENGAIEFYSITDRGPNGDSPKYKEGDKKYDSKIFPSPNFTPSIAVLKLENNKVTVTNTLPLKNKNGQNISGLPITPGSVGSTGEIALDSNLKKLPYDNNGLDTESIAVDSEGNFWTSDEYGPFIIKFDKNGKELQRYAPGAGLPEILKYRQPNRGFEGLTISPSGKIFAAVQSGLNVNGETDSTAQFTRIIELDPKTGKVRTFAYPIDADAYKKVKDAKIGDIYAVSDTKMLIIEQGSDKDGKMRNLIYSIDLSSASDITDIQYEGKAPEYTKNMSLLSNVNPIKKELLVDLREYGWDIEKAEGLCVLPDGKTIAVVNDNDFGMKTKITDSQNSNSSLGDYIINSDGTTSYKEKITKASFDIVENSAAEKNPQLWLFKLSNSLLDENKK